MLSINKRGTRKKRKKPPPWFVTWLFKRGCASHSTSGPTPPPPPPPFSPSPHDAWGSLEALKIFWKVIGPGSTNTWDQDIDRIYTTNLIEKWGKPGRCTKVEKWKRRVPANDRDPSGQFLKILNMESKSLKQHKKYFLVFLVLDGIGRIWLYWIVLNHSHMAT